MSRVHDALRRADAPKPEVPDEPPAPPAVHDAPAARAFDRGESRIEPAAPVQAVVEEPPLPAMPPPAAMAPPPPAARVEPVPPPPTPLAQPAPSPSAPPAEIPARRTTTLPGLVGRVDVVPFNPPVDASLLDPFRPTEGPIEEFRGIRTRMNHMQGQRPIRNVVITSPSPAEGKSFTAANLAITQAQLEGNYVLLADFDFRRPSIHHLFQIDRSPGLTDYLQGKVLLEQCIKRIEGTNLFVMPAGESVNNPLELLNLPEAKRVIDYLSTLFRWMIIDTPPLLFAADANLLSTLCDASVLVVRVGATTVDSVTRAMQSLCQNNILGIIVNAAHRGELYSKFTYYHSYYYSKPD